MIPPKGEEETDPSRILDWHRDVRTFELVMAYFRQRLDPKLTSSPGMSTDRTGIHNLVAEGGLYRRLCLEQPALARDIRVFVNPSEGSRFHFFLHIETPDVGNAAAEFMGKLARGEGEREFHREFAKLCMVCQRRHREWQKRSGRYFRLEDIPPIDKTVKEWNGLSGLKNLFN